MTYFNNIHNKDLSSNLSEPIISNDLLSLTYSNINSNNSIKYLFDYSDFLTEKNLYDPQILNWQIENRILLQKSGLNFDFLKKKIDEQNKYYYKSENFINNMTYRLEKHGALAPSKEIAKFINIKDYKGENEINYYDKNDSFIDDEDEYKGEDDDGIFQINLKPGNYSEEEIIKNLNRNKKKKKLKSIHINNKNNNSYNVYPNNLNDNNNSIIKISQDFDEGDGKKKKKFAENINYVNIEIITKEIVNKCLLELITEYISIGNKFPNNMKEIENCLKKILPPLKPILEKDKNLFKLVFSEKFKIPFEDSSVLIDFEIFKSKIEGIFSTLSKLINQLMSNLSDNNIKNFNDILKINEKLNFEYKNKLDGIITKILSYKNIINEYFKQNENIELINNILIKFISDIKERNNIEEFYCKIPNKLKEYVDKFNINFNIDIFINYIKNVYDKNETEEIEKYLLNTNTNLINKKIKKKSNINKNNNEDEKKDSPIILYDVKDYIKQNEPYFGENFYNIEYNPEHFNKKN